MVLPTALLEGAAGSCGRSLPSEGVAGRCQGENPVATWLSLNEPQ